MLHNERSYTKMDDLGVPGDPHFRKPYETSICMQMMSSKMMYVTYVPSRNQRWLAGESIIELAGIFPLKASLVRDSPLQHLIAKWQRKMSLDATVPRTEPHSRSRRE